METAKEHHGREYVIGGIGAIAEYLAVRYDMSWLAWLAALLLWLAVVEYTRHSASIKRGWKPAIWIGLALAMAIATFYLARDKTTHELAKTSEPLPSPAKAQPVDNDDHRQSAPAPKPKSKQREPQTKIEQHGNGSGAVGGNLIQGPCSIAQVGGANNQASVNCTPQAPPPKVNFTQKELAPGVGLNQLVPHWSMGGHTAADDVVAKRRESFADNPGVLVQMFLDGPWPNATFAAVCDRPCEGMDAVADNSVSSSGQGRINDTTVLVGFVVPSPLPANFPIKWEIRSQSKEKVNISKVVLALPK